MMKKLMVLGLIAVMVMAFAMSASAYIIKVQGGAPGSNPILNGSANGQISNEQDSFTPLSAALSAEATYALFRGNVVDGEQGHTLKMLSSPNAWYGTALGRGGYNGDIEVHFWSTTTASKLAAGTWYLYKGIAQIDGNNITNVASLTLLDKGTFSTAESTWATAGMSGVLKAGEYFTLTTAEAVPEPGSMVAMLSGLVGLVGFGIRRRK